MKFLTIITLILFLLSNYSHAAQSDKEKEVEARFDECKSSCDKIKYQSLNDRVSNKGLWTNTEISACLKKCLIIFKRDLNNIDQAK